MIDFTQYLTHTCTYERKKVGEAASLWGTPTENFYSPVTGVSCLCYYGSVEWLKDIVKTESSVMLSAPTSWQLVMPLAYCDLVKPGDKISLIKDEGLNTIREDGLVKEAKVYRHWVYGPQIVIAILAE